MFGVENLHSPNIKDEMKCVKCYSQTWFGFPLILLLLAPGSGDKEFKNAMNLHRKQRHVEARDALRSFISRFPKSTHQPEALYTYGRLMRNPETAFKTYQDIQKRYPKSKVADDALFMIGQYFEAKGNLQKAQDTFVNLTHRYPDSDLAEEAQKWLIKNAQTPYEVKGIEKTETQLSIQNANAGYSIQVGSFESVPDAHKLRERLLKKGYPVTITHTLIEGKSFHRVRVGPFSTREEALQNGEVLKEKEDLPAWVVKNE
jgi:tetratricopeptide (TPR) repeat protein